MHVYAIQDKDGNVKIGRSMQPRKRLIELQCGNANKLTLLAVCYVSNPDEVEKHFHDVFGDLGLRISGEWFKPSVIVTIVVNSMMCDDLQQASQLAMDCWCYFAKRNENYEEMRRRHTRAKAERMKA